MGRGECGRFLDLDASKVAVMDNCGRLDPLACIDSFSADWLGSPTGLFGARARSLPKAASFRAGARCKYVKLVKRELRAGKLGLASDACAAASVFVVGKRDSEAQREVWDGSLVSDAAMPPPKPPRLPNLCALADLESSADRPAWISGRDAETYSDQLSLPPALRPFMGRPAVTLVELRVGSDGLSESELRLFLEDGAALGHR